MPQKSLSARLPAAAIAFRGYNVTNLGRTPDLVTFDVHGDYPINFGKTKMTLMLDVFNLFQSQEATAFEDTVELTAGVTDPDFLKPIQYQAPRQWRLAARWDF